MTWLNKIWFILLLLIAISARGQEGSVVVHSDPRLSLLLKRPHNSDPIASNITIHKPVNKLGIAAPSVPSKPVKKATATPTANSSAKPLALKTGDNNIAIAGNAAMKSQPATVTNVSSNANANINTIAAKPSNVKISSDDASTTGHMGGWSPPPHRESRVVYSGKGYRVQIYNGPDRNKAMEIKAEFMHAYPGMRTYLTYISPCFRVKVGNYRSRNEALGMLREVRSMYSTPCMIVPDIITISTF